MVKEEENIITLKLVAILISYGILGKPALCRFLFISTNFISPNFNSPNFNSPYTESPNPNPEPNLNPNPNLRIGIRRIERTPYMPVLNLACYVRYAKASCGLSWFRFCVPLYTCVVAVCLLLLATFPPDGRERCSPVHSACSCSPCQARRPANQRRR